MSNSSGEYIAGSRPRGDRPVETYPSLLALQQDRQLTQMRDELERRVIETDAPCRDRPEWTSDNLPDARRAQLMCAMCPLATFLQCEKYAKRAKVAWGVWHGTVYRNDGKDSA